jgi:hypothetical protein
MSVLASRNAIRACRTNDVDWIGQTKDADPGGCSQEREDEAIINRKIDELLDSVLRCRLVPRKQRRTILFSLTSRVSHRPTWRVNLWPP